MILLSDEQKNERPSDTTIRQVAQINRRITQATKSGALRDTSNFKDMQAYLHTLQKVNPDAVTYIPNSGKRYLKFTTQIKDTTFSFIQSVNETKNLTKQGYQEDKEKFKQVYDSWGEVKESDNDTYFDRFFRIYYDKDVKDIVNKYKNSYMLPSELAITITKELIHNNISMSKADFLKLLETTLEREARANQKQKYESESKQSYDRTNRPFN